MNEVRICRIANVVAGRFVIGSDDGIFSVRFQDLREKVKALKEEWSQKAGRELQALLEKDLADLGFVVGSVTVSLGKYKGSRFVTSAKVTVTAPTEAKAHELAKHLLRYSPKYVMKSFDPATGVAEYNIR